MRVTSVIHTYQRRLNSKPYVPSTTLGRATFQYCLAVRADGWKQARRLARLLQQRCSDTQNSSTVWNVKTETEMQENNCVFTFGSLCLMNRVDQTSPVNQISARYCNSSVLSPQMWIPLWSRRSGGRREEWGSEALPSCVRPPNIFLHYLQIPTFVMFLSLSDSLCMLHARHVTPITTISSPLLMHFRTSPPMLAFL